MVDNGIMHQVKYIPSFEIGGKDCILKLKWHGLKKHDTCDKYKKNMLLFAAKRPTTILQQLNNATSIESKRKRVQFAILFQLLFHGRPMVEFESRFALYKLLEVPTLEQWIDLGAMANHMYDFVKNKMREIIGPTTYVALTNDETSSVDNILWMAIHMYVIQNCARVPMLVYLLKLDTIRTIA